MRTFGIEATDPRYAPVGFGDHHWTVTDAAGSRWFLTVADLEHKEHCGVGAGPAERGLRSAMRTAAALRAERGLDFVVAPLVAPDGETVRPLDARYALSVFPWTDGDSGEFGEAFTEAERHTVLDRLAELHREPPPAATPALGAGLPAREGLEAALRETATPWTGGPFAEGTRGLLAEHGGELRRRLDELDAWVAGAEGAARVVTHGEPHSANVLRPRDAPERLLLVDWDTVGLAVPERDLWHVVRGPEDLDRYARTSGRTPDPVALAAYRQRWDLDDLSVYLGWFRAPHRATGDTEAAWEGLVEIVRRLASGPAVPYPSGT
ncbi:phosphotransferase [Streptomyces sp. AJS327]|nr:phosphotransferase [Streptomyces sp. AJS327]